VGARAPGFAGAYLAGSIAGLPDDGEVPATSDVDVMTVVDDPDAAGRRGKRLHRGVLLDVTYLARGRMVAERVLGDHHLAAGLSTPGVLADPTGWLTALQAEVARAYAEPAWIRRRCASAIATSRRFLGSLEARAPLHDQVTACVFGAGVTAHVLLVAGLRNPTVRTRYAAVRELLEERRRLDLHERLLALAGCGRIEPETATGHLEAVAAAFDAAAPALRTPVFFASDLTPAARPIAIDGSRDLIARGRHREAMFWIGVTYSRCRAVLLADAPRDAAERHEPGYRSLLADLGLDSDAQRAQRAADVEAFLPRLSDEAESLI
jgi:hypothetical protein